MGFGSVDATFFAEPDKEIMWIACEGILVGKFVKKLIIIATNKTIGLMTRNTLEYLLLMLAEKQLLFFDKSYNQTFTFCRV